MEEEKKKMINKGIKKWGGIILIVGILFYGGYKFVTWLNTPVEIPDDAAKVQESDWVKGEREAKVVIFEYADFQCPACVFYSGMVKQITIDFPEDVVVVFRHLPLASIHRNALNAAYAAEAAGVQGKFWEMHDLLFDRQEEWSDKASAKETFSSYAEELDLDVEQFLKDFKSDEIKDLVSNDQIVANSLKLNSTPSFIINNKLIKNPGTFEEFAELIQNELNNE